MSKPLHFSNEDRILLISDLHLEVPRQDIYQAFKQLMKSIIAANRSSATAADRSAQPTPPDSSTPTPSTLSIPPLPPIQALFILGDFFEVWIGDDHRTEFTDQVADHLKAVADSGTEIYFMAGNRDFLLGEQFCKRAGMTRLTDPTEMFIGTAAENRTHGNNGDNSAQRYLLMHGDSLCTDDDEYMTFRKMVRSSQWQQDFLNKPIEERLAIAHSLREQSKRRYQSENYSEICDVSQITVEHVLNQHDVDILIHGHTHRPKIHTVCDEKKRVVLGDWEKNGWFILLQSANLELTSFPLSPKVLG